MCQLNPIQTLRKSSPTLSCLHGKSDPDRIWDIYGIPEKKSIPFIILQGKCKERFSGSIIKTEKFVYFPSPENQE